MKTIRLTVIGSGGIADRRAIPALLQDPQNKIVAVMDRKEEVAKAIAEKYGVERYFTDAQEMLEQVSCAASKLEIYGTEGSIYAEATLSQEETGKLRYIYSPQGAYEAQQNLVVTKAKNYYGKRGNIYGKQFKAFNALIAAGKTDYANAEQALHIQKLCDDIYAQ